MQECRVATVIIDSDDASNEGRKKEVLPSADHRRCGDHWLVGRERYDRRTAVVVPLTTKRPAHTFREHQCVRTMSAPTMLVVCTERRGLGDEYLFLRQRGTTS